MTFIQNTSLLTFTLFTVVYSHNAIADACGLATSPNSSVVCNTSNYVSGSINYLNVDGLTITIDDPSLTILGTSGNAAIRVVGIPGNTNSINFIGNAGNIIANANNRRGVQLINDDTGDNNINFSGGIVSTTGNNGRMIESTTISGNNSIEFSGGLLVSNAGQNSLGLVAYVNGTGNATISISGGEIRQLGVGLSGRNSSAVRASTLGTGYIGYISMSGGSILTNGNASHGLFIPNDSASATVSSRIDFSDGSIETNAQAGRGVFIRQRGPLGSSEINVTGGTVTTNGGNGTAVAIFHENFNGQSIDSIIRFGGNAEVNTSGNLAHGVIIQQSAPNATGIAQIQITGGTVDSTGGNADAVRLESNADHEISITGGQLSAGTGDAAVVQTVSGAGATSSIIIEGNAILNGSRSGRVISTGGANDQITIRGGSLNGSIFTGAGDDTLTITSAANISDVLLLEGGTGSDTLNLQGTNFSGYTPVDLTPNTGKALLNWQNINLQENASLKLSGN